MRLVFYLRILLAGPGFAQTVTATANVRVDGKIEHVRKINARWWSDENRQICVTAVPSEVNSPTTS